MLILDIPQGTCIDTPLHIACRENMTEIAQHILQAARKQADAEMRGLIPGFITPRSLHNGMPLLNASGLEVLPIASTIINI